MRYIKNIAGTALATMLFFHVDHIEAQRGAQANWSLEQDARTAVDYAETIKADELKTHLTILASDEYEGRETGKAGQKKAAQYLADYYSGMGITPCVNGSWFQSYPLKKESLLNSYATLGGKRYQFIDDFHTFGGEWKEMEAKDIVFVGYGIEEAKYSDYSKIDVTGKIVMCLLGEPTDKKGRSRITGSEASSDWSMDPGMKKDLAVSKGAKGIIYVNMDYAEYMNRVRYWLEQAPVRLDNPEREKDVQEGLPNVFISPAMANDILRSTGKSVQQLQQKMNKKGKTVSLNVSTDAVFHMEREIEKLTAENVLCFIEGSDPELKDEVVIISAHYDHIGIVNGQINNGADDDGSGTVSAMEIAQAFIEAKRARHGTRRSILILHVSGEEKGLLGSEWYSDFPVFPLANTVCDLNIDMIGRKDDSHTDENYVYLIGSDKLSTDLHKISEKCNSEKTKLALDYTYNDPKDPNRFYYRSDHYNFAKHNIPVIFYFSGVHADYHKPGDDVEKIMFNKMETIARLVFYTAWEVANRDEKLKVDVTNDFGKH